MKSSRVARLEPYLMPGGAEWSKLPREEVALIATPLAMQPTEYVRKSWADKAYGQTNPLRVAAVHDGAMLAVLMSWVGVAPAGKDFPDAIAMAMPVRGNPPLALMGTPEAPIHVLRWQANEKAPRSILATGIGSSRPGPEVARQVQAWTEGGSWNVVLARALGGSGEVAPLAVGSTTRIGFAVWRGDNDERAGIKAFSIDWAELALDA